MNLSLSKKIIVLFCAVLLTTALGCGKSNSSSSQASQDQSQSQSSQDQSQSTQNQNNSQPTGNVTYTANVKSVLDSKCISCHSAKGSQSDLPLDTYANVFKIVTAGNPANSKLVNAIENGSMSDKVNSDDVTLIKNWVQQGAKQ